MAKIKVFGFSKAGKRLFKTIIGLIIGFFTIVGIITTSIIFLQIKTDTTGLYTLRYQNMINNIAFNHGYEINNGMADKKKFSIFGIDFYEIEKGKSKLEIQIPAIKGNEIKLDNTFTGYDSDIVGPKYLNIPIDSKYTQRFGETIYGEETDIFGQPKIIGQKINEIKIELTSTKNIVVTEYNLNNSNYKYFRENNLGYEMRGNFRRDSLNSKDFETGETACIILTPINPITKIDKELHDENCEFRHLGRLPEYLGYNEILIEINAIKFKDSENLPHIKITPITIEKLRDNKN